MPVVFVSHSSKDDASVTALEKLMPLYLRLRELILGSAKIAIDETVVPVRLGGGALDQ